MAKNIILCADGTGNKGGSTPDSNVYKIYKAINLHHDQTEQISFYDNGVGTQSNTYIRALSGAVGLGFKHNVCDLYEYLSRHYDPGDKIYLFGFSRGAATIRAFNGFIDACGLIDGRGYSNKRLKDAVKVSFTAYRQDSASQRTRYLNTLNFHKEKPVITFIGVWDTVSALGFPERMDSVTPVLGLLNALFKGLSFIIDMIIPHKFYNYELTPNISTARQALAIDDERTSFWPMVWKNNAEIMSKIDSVQQVWFAGMHSNVGGGYERSGLANSSYYWMLKQIQGLEFKEGTLENARIGANVNGRIYNSRAAFASFYRYHPREIEQLCLEAGTEVQLHESVMRRLALRTANYAPRLLPESFSIVDNENNKTTSPKVHGDHWRHYKKMIKRTILARKVLYGIQLDIVMAIFFSALYFWIFCDSASSGPGKALSSIQTHMIKLLEYFTPTMFDGLIQYIVVQAPFIGYIIIPFIAVFLFLRNKARKVTSGYAEHLRRLILRPEKPHPGGPS